MDLPILLAVVTTLRGQLLHTSLADIREDRPDRFRFLFVGLGGEVRSIVVSIDPDRPWIGRPALRWPERSAVSTSFTATLRRRVKGLHVTGIDLPVGDRTVMLRFGDGHVLAAQLVHHRADLVLVDKDGTACARARRPRGPATTSGEGSPYVGGPPPRVPDPRSLTAAEIDARIAIGRAEGLEVREALRRELLGIGAETARLVVEDARAGGESAGEVLSRRLVEVAAGHLSPIVLAAADPRVALRDGTLDPAAIRLLPWRTGDSPPSLGVHEGDDPSATVGLYHDVLDHDRRDRARLASLRKILNDELRRAWNARTRVEADLTAFDDANVHRLRGEALLAGLSRARRVGATVFVPDPYSSDGAEIAIPADPGVSLTACANGCFRLHRRAVRGQAHARARRSSLGERIERLRAIDLAHLAPDSQTVASLERRLRSEGVPIEARSSARGRPAGPARRAEGVRTFRAPGGRTVLAGKSGPGNDRVTFRLASPDDIWLHARDVPGAHVVLRGEAGEREPDISILRFAAGLAAWFSDARPEPLVDVQWTRRKYVRRLRGAPAGTVVLKKFQVVRVRPQAPAEEGQT